MTNSYYDGWETTSKTCEKCGWRGLLKDAETELFSELMEVNCPKCSGRLSLVMFPTALEAMQVPNLPRADKLYYAAIITNQSNFDRLSLKQAAQLPDIDAPSIVLSWDMEMSVPERDTVIKHGEREIWREPCRFDGYIRFEQAVEILKEKYGQRLHDVVPTDVSTMDLYGDSVAAPSIVRRIREALHPNDP